LDNSNENIKNNNRIIKNSLFLYFRLILTLCISLYTSRTVLYYLGVEDFGIYNVVGGIVTMMTFLSGAMASASQRFFSYEIGKGNKEQLKKVFKMSVNIHLIIIIMVLILAETLVLKFVNSTLVIPLDRVSAANVVYQCTVFSFCFSVLAVPYNAMILANENMRAFAYIGICDVLLKLLVVLFLTVGSYDKLEQYAYLSTGVSFVIFLFYYIYSTKNFDASKYSIYWDFKLFKEMINYTGWNLFGNLASVLSIQGVNILLNVFFGATVNAARAVSFQVNSAIMGFVNSLQMSINPQIVKSYAANKIEYMLELVMLGSKYSFLLIYLLSLPILLQTNYVLQLWLVTIPQDTSIFCRLVLVDALVISLSGPLMTAFQATGKIKFYQISVGGILLLNLPISYLFLEKGFSSYSVAFVSIFLSVVALLVRMILLTKIVSFNVIEYTKKVLVKVFMVVLCTSPPLLLFNNFYLNINVHLKFIIVVVFSFILTFFSIYYIALSTRERAFVKEKIKKVRNILLKKQRNNEHR
jgi:O-antigen/teichoic acid export membrane protein